MSKEIVINPKYTILDLDGCIADDRWRRNRIDRLKTNMFERYKDYHLSSSEDNVANTELFLGVENLVIMTARPLQYYSTTTRWMDKHGVPWSAMFMRGHANTKSSVEVKREFCVRMFTELNLTAADIKVAYDDKPKVIEMYKELGINAVLKTIGGDQE